MHYNGEQRFTYETIGGVKAIMTASWGLTIYDQKRVEEAGRQAEEAKKIAAEEKRKADEARWQKEKAEVDALSRSLRANDPRQPGETRKITLPGGAEMEMVWCPPGAFMMGSPKGTEGAKADETEHRVTLTEGFWMAKTEVTRQQWKSVMGSVPQESQGDNFPVSRVTWQQCRIFCSKSGLSLPTEAQWEYACRAGTTGSYGGTGTLDEMGWFSGNSGKEHHPVGQKKANAWGLFDMHGNVCEWCWDSYPDAYSIGIRYSRDSVTNPVCNYPSLERVVRGGYTSSSANQCRSAFPMRTEKTNVFATVGFRPVCRELESRAQTTALVIYSLGEGKEAGETKTVPLPNGATMDFVWCPPGTFLMGRRVEAKDGGRLTWNQRNERQHQVTLTAGFWMAKTEVTQAQWLSVMEANPSRFKGNTLPVENATWEECREFCEMFGLELPTEAQWEYACRAGSTGAFSGTEPLDELGWYNDNSKGQTHPVGMKKPNAWGFHDMHGNVSEWCADWFAPYPSKDAVKNPKGPASEPKISYERSSHVFRGGGWESGEVECRSPTRGRGRQIEDYQFSAGRYVQRSPNVGFRPCHTIVKAGK
jgi:formylglycine-generating enzyme required for sulfatase activity